MNIAQIIADEKAAADREFFKGYRVGELRAAFNRIANEGNWKEELAGIVNVSDVEMMTVAAEFFAGSPLKVIYTEPYRQGEIQRCVVKGPGYYACVGA